MRREDHEQGPEQPKASDTYESQTTEQCAEEHHLDVSVQSSTAAVHLIQNRRRKQGSRRQLRQRDAGEHLLQLLVQLIKRLIAAADAVRQPAVQPHVHRILRVLACAAARGAVFHNLHGALDREIADVVRMRGRCGILVVFLRGGQGWGSGSGVGRLQRLHWRRVAVCGLRLLRWGHHHVRAASSRNRCSTGLRLL